MACNQILRRVFSINYTCIQHSALGIIEKHAEMHLKRGTKERANSEQKLEPRKEKPRKPPFFFFLFSYFYNADPQPHEREEIKKQIRDGK